MPAPHTNETDIVYVQPPLEPDEPPHMSIDDIIAGIYPTVLDIDDAEDLDEMYASPVVVAARNTDATAPTARRVTWAADLVESTVEYVVVDVDGDGTLTAAPRRKRARGTNPRGGRAAHETQNQRSQHDRAI